MSHVATKESIFGKTQMQNYIQFLKERNTNPTFQKFKGNNYANRIKRIYH